MRAALNLRAAVAQAERRIGARGIPDTPGIRPRYRLFSSEAAIHASNLTFGQPVYETHGHLLKEGEGEAPQAFKYHC